MRIAPALLCLGSLAATAAADAAAPVFAVAPPGGGQAALAVGFDEGGSLRARACATKRCDVSGGAAVEVPEPYKSRAKQSTLTVVPIGQNRRAVLVKIPGGSAERSWQGIYAAAVGGGGVITVFEGETGWTRGQWGERSGAMVQVSDARDDGTRTVLVGEQHEHLSICGRPTILAPKMLSPKKLTLGPARVQRLSPAERDAAPELRASAVEPGASQALPVLRATGASSAVGDPRALTDGDPETVWSENRGGDGRGELVVMTAPSELPLVGFEFVARPPTKDVPKGVAPSSFFLATDKGLYRVVVDGDAWKTPGARYRVELPQAVRTSCVALVLDSAAGAKRDSQVSLAELNAHTNVNAGDVPSLVKSLTGGGPKAQAAAAALTLVGDEAFSAVAKAFATLDEGGRRVALDVMDHAPCSHSAPVYVAALVGAYEPQRIHARARLPRCAGEATKVIDRTMQRDPRRLPVLAKALAEISPKAAVQVLVPKLRTRDPRVRRALRIALGRAASSPRAKQTVAATLRDPALGPEVTLDLLRALGPRVTEHLGAAGVAMGRVNAARSEFRIRYLRLEPAGHLARGDASARALVSSALRADPSAYVRVRAAEVVTDPLLFRAELLQALDDGDVRVREAAAGAVATRASGFASAALVRRLADDEWPIVRAAAATALAHHGSNPNVDRALGTAVADESRHVRGPVITALGRRKARSQAPVVRERLEADDESPDVRARAAEALGLMCDFESVTALTRSAKRLADPMLPAEERGVSTMALGALARLRPSDLSRRLAPLLEKTAPHTARAAAEASLRGRGSCGRVRRQ